MRCVSEYSDFNVDPDGGQFQLHPTADEPNRVWQDWEPWVPHLLKKFAPDFLDWLPER